MSTQEMNRRVHELRELRRMAEEINAEIEGITDLIKAEMTAQNTDTLAGDDYKITWKEVSSPRLDSKAFKAALPDLYEIFTKQHTVRRFSIAI